MSEVYNPRTGKIENIVDAIKGDLGPIGLLGPQGLPGKDGVPGIPGEQGPAGARGMRGLKGLDGTPGIPGERGPRGTKGDEGPIGLTGPDGNLVHYSVLKPKDNIGNNGDWAFTETEEIYRKDKNRWVFYRGINTGIARSTTTVTSTSTGVILLGTDVTTAPTDLVIITADNFVSKITDNLLTTIPNGILGIALDKPTATTVNVVTNGRVPGFAGLTVNQYYFISTTGILTATPPATGVLQRVCWALSSTEVFVQPTQPMARND